MNDDQNDLIKAAAEGAAEGFGKQIPPVYTDLMKPATVELGKGLGGIVKLALAPVTALIWGYEKIGNYLNYRLEELLQNTPAANILSPNPAIVGPAIEAIRFLDEENDLREMFAKLIASSLDSDKRDLTHPGFIEIIKNLSGRDAIFLDFLYKVKGDPIFGEPWFTGSRYMIKDSEYNDFAYIRKKLQPWTDQQYQNSYENLFRLGIVENSGVSVEDPVYDDLYSDEWAKFKPHPDNSYSLTIVRITLTSYGKAFCSSCLG